MNPNEHRAFLGATIIALLLSGLLQPNPTAAQTDLTGLGHTFAWHYSREVPAGTILGVVLGAEGRPLTGAQVSVHDTTETITVRGGRFQFSEVPPGIAKVSVQLIGYDLSDTSLLVPSDLGVQMVVLLPKSATVGGGPCGDMVPFGDGVSASVTDSISGRTPDVPVTLRLIQGGVSWERTATLPQLEYGTPSLFLPHSVESRGLYDIEVTAPGYYPWRRNAVELGVNWRVCGPVPRNRHQIVRLVPKGG